MSEDPVPYGDWPAPRPTKILSPDQVRPEPVEVQLAQAQFDALVKRLDFIQDQLALIIGALNRLAPMDGPWQRGPLP